MCSIPIPGGTASEISDFRPVWVECQLDGSLQYERRSYIRNISCWPFPPWRRRRIDARSAAIQRDRRRDDRRAARRARPACPRIRFPGAAHPQLGKGACRGRRPGADRSWEDAPSPSGAFSAISNACRDFITTSRACRRSGSAKSPAPQWAGVTNSPWLRPAYRREEAKIGLPEVGLGLIPGAGGTQRLTRLCGRGVAARVILTGEPVDGSTAAALGMVEWCVPRAEMPRGPRDRRPPRNNAVACAARSQAMHSRVRRTGTLGFQLERDLGGALLDSPRTQQLIGEFLARNSK